MGDLLLTHAKLSLEFFADKLGFAPLGGNRMKIGFCLAASMLAFSTVAKAEEIDETMSKGVRAELTSPKPPADLEVCVANAITQIGGAVPVPLRNGGGNVMMLGYGHTPKIVITMDSAPSGTSLKVYTKSGDMDDKLVRSLLEACDGMTLLK